MLPDLPTEKIQDFLFLFIIEMMRSHAYIQDNRMLQSLPHAYIRDNRMLQSLPHAYIQDNRMLQSLPRGQDLKLNPLITYSIQGIQSTLPTLEFLDASSSYYSPYHIIQCPLPTPEFLAASSSYSPYHIIQFPLPTPEFLAASSS